VRAAGSTAELPFMECRAENRDTRNNRNPKSTVAEMESVVDGDDEGPNPLSTPSSSSVAV
jgi:hypothetical protein